MTWMTRAPAGRSANALTEALAALMRRALMRWEPIRFAIVLAGLPLQKR